MEISDQRTMHGSSRDEVRLLEMGYHKHLNRWVAVATMPGFVFFTIYFGVGGDSFQAVLYFFLAVNALWGLALSWHFRQLRSLTRLKSISAGIAFSLLSLSFIVGMLSQRHAPLFFPWIFLFPLAVVLFFGRRVGLLCALLFCLAMTVVLLWTDLQNWHPSSLPLFRYNLMFALLTLLAIAAIAENYRVQVQRELMAAQNESKEAERRQREANLELQRQIERRSESERSLALSETRYRALFEESAISLLEENWSLLKTYLDALPAGARTDLSAYCRQHPETLQVTFKMAQVTAINQATLHLFEAEQLEPLLANLSAVLPQGAGDFLLERLVALYLNGRHDTEMICHSLKGRPLHVLISSTVPVGFEATWGKVFTSITDITDRVAVEQEKVRVAQQLQHGRQIQAIATLAGGIAHQFNNALAVISGNLELLQAGGAASDARRWEALRSSTTRMSRLTDQLLAYALGGKYRPKRFSANHLIHEVMDAKKIDPDHSPRMVAELAADILLVTGDTTQIVMVLEAVLANALEAMEGMQDGVLKISTRNQRIEGGEMVMTPGLYVVIRIEDNGVGMEAEAIERIFEPFYTTKIFGRGLGMAAAYGIVTNHDGMITVESELNAGTGVTIYLPGHSARMGSSAL
jgi:signal transduction histidine kinase